MQSVNVHLAVANVATSMAFLEKVFGFTRGVVLPDAEDQVRYAEMRHGDVVVMLIRKGRPRGGRHRPRRVPVGTGDLQEARAFRLAAFALNLATRSISLAGTGSESGKRKVPLLALNGASFSPMADISSSVAGYSE